MSGAFMAPPSLNRALVVLAIFAVGGVTDTFARRGCTNSVSIAPVRDKLKGSYGGGIQEEYKIATS